MSNQFQSLCIGLPACAVAALYIQPNSLQFPRERRPLRGDPIAAAAALKAKRAQWAKLSLRQRWADESSMRAHLRAAGITVASDAEPATPDRLQRLLKRAGVRTDDARQAVGTDIESYLALNPDLPLWAALALVLEATGRFKTDSSQELREGSH